MTICLGKSFLTYESEFGLFLALLENLYQYDVIAATVTDT